MQKKLPKLALSIAMFTGVFLLWSKAQAATIYEQTDFTTTITDSSMTEISDGTTWESEITTTGSIYFTMYMTYDWAGFDCTAAAPQLTIYRTSDDLSMARYVIPTAGCGVGTDPILQEGQMNIDNNLTAGTSYYLALNRSANPAINYRISGNTLGDWGIYLSSDGVLPPEFNTRWLAPYTPENGVTTASTSVSFSADYYFDCTSSFGLLDRVAFEIVDATTGESGPTRFGSTQIATCGTATLNANRTLTTGHFYLWRPVIFSSSGTTTPIEGQYYSINGVVTPSASSTPFLGATVGTSTLPNTTNLLSFLNVPTLLQTKIPFAYIFQIADGIKVGMSSSTAATIPSGTFTWKGVTGATTTIDMFSTTTIGYYLSPTLIGLWREFELAILYITFGYALYRRAKHKDLI